MKPNFVSVEGEWFADPRADILAGVVVALALIPEAIGFSVIVGVDPKVGLYASFAIATIIAFVGGRQGMVSGATASVAVVVASLARAHGVDYLFAATILMGVFEFIAGLLRLDRLMQFVSRPVITGFVNALAILIFMAQLPQLTHVPSVSYLLVAGGLAIIYLFPHLTKVLPSSLVAIAVLTIVTIWGGIHVNTVGDMGKLPTLFPTFAIPHVPLTLDTLRIIAPYSLAMAAVGLLESMLTARIVDDFTATPSNKSREMKGQGIANFITGFLGGMGGCAMIGQSVVNMTSGGRSRLSTLTAGVFLLFILLVLNPIVARIPMPSLIAVMIMVSISTFAWPSISAVWRDPWQSSLVMIITFAVVIWTGNLATGVIIGSLLSTLILRRQAEPVGEPLVKKGSANRQPSD